MARLKFSPLQYTGAIILVSLIIQFIPIAILRYVHNELWAIALDVFALSVGDGLITFMQDSESPARIALSRMFISASWAPTAAFWTFMIVIANAGGQLISSILPVYIHNQVEVAAIQLFISVVVSGLVAYLSTLESQAPANVLRAVKISAGTVMAFIVVVLVLILAIIIALKLKVTNFNLSPVGWVTAAIVLLIIALIGILIFLVWLRSKLNTSQVTH